MQIPGRGPVNSKLLVLSTAPGKYEGTAKLAFAGPAGDELRKMLSKAGAKINECRFDNIMQEVVANRDDEESFSYEAMQRWMPSLKKRIEEQKPNCILALGSPALHATTGRTGIMKWRGSILDSTICDGVKVVGAFDPAFIMRNWGCREYTVWDYARAWEESRTRELSLPQWNIEIRPSFDQVVAAKDRLLKSDKIVYDIEGDRNIVCLGLGDANGWAISIPFVCSDGTRYWNIGAEAAIWRIVAEILASDVEKVAQNAPYDQIQLRLNGIEIRNQRWDTLKMHNCVWSEFPHSLAFLCSVYTKQPFYKDEGKTWEKGLSEDRFWIYNGTDVCVTGACFKEIYKEMQQLGVLDFYQKHYADMHDILISMELDGFSVDKDVQREKRKEVENDIKTLQPLVDELAGGPLNVLSPKQMKTFVENKLGLKVPFNRRTRKPTLDDDALNMLLAKHNPQLLEYVVHLRKARKMLGSYIDIDLGEDGRVHCHFGYTESHRLKSSKSVLGTGFNLQTLPESTRAMYVADSPDFLIGHYDLSQAEDRWVAWAAPVPKKIELYSAGKKVHTYFAAVISEAFTGKHLEYHEIPKDNAPGSLYFTAKRTVHGNNYGLGTDKFAMLVRQPLDVAKALQEIYHREFPEVRGLWWLDVQDQLSKNRGVRNPDGSFRYFFDRWGDDLFRAAYAHGPQEGVCFHMNQTIVALVRAYAATKVSKEAFIDFIGSQGIAIVDADVVFEALRDSLLSIKLQIHDACAYQAIAETIPFVAQIADGAANRPIVGLKGGPFVIPAEHSFGQSLGEQKGFNPYDTEAPKLARRISEVYRESRKSRSLPLLDGSDNIRGSVQS